MLFVFCLLVLVEQEWPHEPFEERCHDLYLDLLQALPLRDYTTPGGKFNLLGYFPVDHQSLDLSFKMYPGQGLGTRKFLDCGTFNLNCGLADELYICTYTAATGGTFSHLF